MRRTASSLLNVRLTTTLEKPTRAQSSPRALPTVAAGVTAQTIARKRVDDPDNRATETCSPPNKSLG